MIIRELVVNNYRPFQEKAFELSERVTVIAGVNGRGKTAILDSLALLLSRLVPQVTPAHGGYKYLKKEDIKHSQDNLDLILRSNFVGIPIEFKVNYSIENGQTYTKLPKQVRDQIKAIYGDPTREGDSAPIAIYYTTDRAGYRLPKTLPAMVPVGQAAAYHGALSNRLIDFRDFMARFRNMIVVQEERRRENPAYIGDRAVRAIEQAITQFMPGFSDLRVEENPLRLLISKGDTPLDLTQLSDGERSFLAIIIDLCRRLTLTNPDLDDPLTGKGVVLIDEIELHLHPTWQRDVVEKLRTIFPQIQFILTTHSPFVVQTLRPGELILLDDEILDPGDYSNRGLEEVAIKVMGIEDPNVVPHYTRMLDAAREYFSLLNDIDTGDAARVAQLKERLNEIVAPFPDEPAYRAFLEMQRVAAFREGNR